MLQWFRYEVLQHPPYSPGFVPCDYHIFGLLKKPINGWWFANNNEYYGRGLLKNVSAPSPGILRWMYSQSPEPLGRLFQTCRELYLVMFLMYPSLFCVNNPLIQLNHFSNLHTLTWGTLIYILGIKEQMRTLTNSTYVL